MKCKLLRMSLLCLLFLFIFCINVSFASVNYSQLEEFSFNGNPKEMLEQCIYKISNFSLEEYGNKIRTADQNAWNLLLSVFNNSDYVSFYYTLNSQANADTSLSNPNAMNFMCFSNDSWSNGNGYNFTIYRKSLNETRCNSSSITSQSLSGSINSSYVSKFLYVSDKWYKATNNSWVVPNINRNLTFNSEKTNTIEVHFSGDTENFIKADYSRDTDTWLLGNFTNVVDSGAVEIYGYLAAYQGSSDSGAIYSDVIASFQWKKDVGLFNNGLVLLEDSNYNVRVVNSRLYYNQGYCLYFNAYDKDRSEILIDNQYNYLYFVPYGSTATSGDLINPQANTNLDWNFINSIEHLYDSPSGNIAFIFNDYNTSGDILGFHYSDYDQWGFGDFIKVSFNNFLDALYNYDNISFDLGILGVHNSSEFIVSNNALITIVSLFSNCFLLLSSIAWFFYTICAIGVLDLDKIIKDKADLGLF